MEGMDLRGLEESLLCMLPLSGLAPILRDFRPCCGVVKCTESCQC